MVRAMIFHAAWAQRAVACGFVALVPLASGAACSSKRTATLAPPSDPSQQVASVEPKAPPPPSSLDGGTAEASADTAGTHHPPREGADFIQQALEIYRVAACGGRDDSTALPAPAAPTDKFDASMVLAHCKELLAMYDDYRTNWVNVAMPTLAALVPKDLPADVVYPFGGGDLLGALATFPDKLEFTTISLEAAGDARKIDTATPKQLKAELALNRTHLGKLFEKAHSRTINLDMESRSDLPGEIVFTMAALVVHGYEPLSLRYFKFNADGTLQYLSLDEITALEHERAARKESKTQAELEIFKDMELEFRKAGDPKAPVKVLRHIAFNLDDKHMKADGSLLKHLEAKGEVTAMTKAASHFLWSDDFSTIRNYLLNHMEWMISDSTGVPPRYATKAGFVQDTYGIMEWPAAFGPVDNRNAEDLRKLFKTNPQKDIPFRYGYPDRDHHGHIVITRRAKPSAPDAAP
jgi:hypothetical protein